MSTLSMRAFVRRFLTASHIAVAGLLVFPFLSQPIAAQQADATEKIRDRIPVQSLGDLPLGFEANRGQTDASVKFLARGKGYSLFLDSKGATLNLKSDPTAQDATTDETVLRMEMVGAQAQPHVTGEGPLPGKANYFVGSDTSKWLNDIPTYEKVHYDSVYPGINLVYYGNQGQLEYDFIVEPGADPNDIALSFTGAGKPTITDNGELEIGLGQAKTVTLQKPVMYQIIEGVRHDVVGSFVIADGKVGFAIGDYNADYQLVIDPVLVYSTYLGGNGIDSSFDIAVDSTNNIYLTGQTSSSNFPTVNPPQASMAGVRDTYITKLNPSGTSILYSTYIGGSNLDVAEEIAVDASGNAYITGLTRSTNFPTTASAFQPNFGGGFEDAFITKLNPSGSSLAYSTYLGGTDLGSESALGIGVDAAGNAYVAGLTNASNFPTANPLYPTNSGATDIFVTKLNPTGTTLMYSTYIGGSNGDEPFGMNIDGNGNAYITGQTRSLNFPTVSPVLSACSFDGSAYITKINAAGSALDYSTCLGGYMYGRSLSVDSAGHAHVVGRASDDGFVAKLNSDASTILYSTLLAGDSFDEPYDVKIDATGNAFVAGWTTSTNFPLVDPIQATRAGENDVFVARLNSAGQITFSTYFGGTNVDQGFSLALDSANHVYVAGHTTSTNFPTMNALQPTPGGGIEGFLFKLFVAPTNLPPTVDANGPYVVIEGGSVIVSATGNDPENGPLTYAWDLDNNGSFETSGQSVTFSAVSADGPGSQHIAVQVTDNGNLTDTDQATVTIDNVAPTATFANTPGTINEDTSATLTFSGQSDPSTADMNAGFVYSYDCTNDGTFEAIDIASDSYACTYADPDSHTTKGRIKDKDGGFTDYTATLTVSDIPTVDDFVLLGTDGVWLKSGVTVNGGDVGANTVGTGPFLDSGVETSIGNNVSITATNSDVYGDSIRLKTGSLVRDVFYNDISGPGMVLDTQNTPLALPVISAFPTVPSFSPGLLDVTVPVEGSQTLLPGSYRNLLLNHDATITLSGGVYNFESWDIRADAKVYFSGPAEVRIAGKIDTALRTEIQPAPAAFIDASGITIFATGINGNTGNLGANPKAAEFGQDTIVRANMYVPNGTLSMQAGTIAEGAFLGKWVIAGQSVTVDFDSAF